MTLINPMIGNYPQGPLVHDWSFVAHSVSWSHAILIPAAAQAGDLCILFDSALGDPNQVPPAGFTLIAFGENSIDGVFSYRQLTANQGGTLAYGQNGNDDYRAKVMMIFRPDIPVTISTGVFQGTMNTDGDPPEMTVNTSAMTNSGVAIAIARHMGAHTLTGEENWNDTVRSLVNRNGVYTSKIFYKLQTIGGLTYPSLDMPDYGSWLTLGGIYFEGTPV